MSTGPLRCRTDDVRGHDAPKWIVDGEYRCDFCVGVMRHWRPDLVATPIATDPDCGCPIGLDHTCGRHEPADPPGLAEAIEAARKTTRGVVWLDDAGQDQTIRIAVRAAAPILTRAAREQELRDAADEIKANAEKYSHSTEREYRQGMRDASYTVRKRADRIGGGQ